jgi:hypothetical protein
MTTTPPSASLVLIRPAFSDPERLALAGFLAGYRGLTREAYTLDLRQFTGWCRERSLPLFADRRADIETFARDLEAKGRARPPATAGLRVARHRPGRQRARRDPGRCRARPARRGTPLTSSPRSSRSSPVSPTVLIQGQPGLAACQAALYQGHHGSDHQVQPSTVTANRRSARPAGCRCQQSAGAQMERSVGHDMRVIFVRILAARVLAAAGCRWHPARCRPDPVRWPAVGVGSPR